MPSCPMCKNDFPLLDQDSTSCGKCKARKPGMSTAEYAVINDKPQCGSCGIMSGNLKHPICNGCITHYKSGRDVPFSILKLHGAARLLLNNAHTEEDENTIETSSTRSALATTVLESAATYQSRASDKRLGVGPSKASKSAVTGLHQFKNLDKAKTILAERKIKKAEAQMLDSGIRVVATVWTADKNKLKQIGQIRVSGVFEPMANIRNSLDEIFEKVRSSFELLFPDAIQLTWSYITLHAHESSSKFTSLQHLDRAGTMYDLYQEFTKGRLGSSSVLNSRTIEIRFAYQKDEIHWLEDEQATEVMSSVAGKRKRASSQSVANLGSRTQSSFNRALASRPSSTILSAVPGLSTRGPVILKSAYRVPTRSQQWTRDPPMRESFFIRTTAVFNAKGNVEFSANSEQDIRVIEVIEIAEDWEKGQTLYEQGKPHETTGFVGKGYSKRGIYARFGGKEYVLTQPMDEMMTNSDANAVLKEEYRLLCQCDGFKALFDQYAKDRNVLTIPSFYFNFQGSIYGEIRASRSSGSRIVPHNFFLATLLLPCGKLDGKVRKFTGSDDIGDAPDSMTKAVHAFAHWSLLYSQGHILFCDLQGALDFKGVMCLFDPQAHTDTHLRHQRNVYWDGGPDKIKAFHEQHAPMCYDNWVCTRLGLRETVVEIDTDTETSTPGSSPKKIIDKQSVNFLVNS